MADATDKNPSAAKESNENTAPLAVTLVPADAPKKESKASKRRGRNVSASAASARRPKPKAKVNGSDTLFLVETEEGSDQFAPESIKTLDDFLDIMDEDRAILVSRSWRRF